MIMEENNESTENPQQGQGRNNAMKCGWLRKQGGFVKTWHTRWFVLKGDQLYYFKDEDETKPLVSKEMKSAVGLSSVRRKGVCSSPVETEANPSSLMSFSSLASFILFLIVYLGSS